MPPKMFVRVCAVVCLPEGRELSEIEKLTAQHSTAQHSTAAVQSKGSNPARSMQTSDPM
jgi:hypothetical protein